VYQTAALSQPLQQATTAADTIINRNLH